MFHSRFYRLFISVILVALMLPASLVQADTGQSVSPQTDTPPKDVRSCPPYNPELAGNVENVQRLAPECRKMYRESLGAGQQMAPQAEALAAGGPDDFGYTFNAAGYSWIAASTNTGLTGDDAYSTLSLPFNFPFYGFNYSQLHFNTNGLITFDQGYTWGGGDNIPYPFAPNNFIAPFWEDLVVGAADGNPAGGIYYQVSGSAPNRYLVLEWRNVDLWNSEASADFSFEAILYENGDIKFQYKSLPSASYYSTAGIEDSLGNDGLQYQYGNSGLAASSAVLFTFPTLPTARVFLSPLSQGSFAVPGGTQAYTVKVANIGTNGIDTYNLTVASSWTTTLYDSGGVTPLADTNGNVTIDTGPIAQGSSVNIVVKVSAPGSAQVGDSNYAGLVATSSQDAGKFAQVNLSTSIPAAFANAFVDASNYAMGLMTASRYQSNNYKLTANDYNGRDIGTIRLLNGNYLYAWDKWRMGQNTGIYEIEYMIVGANGSTVRGVTRLGSLYSVSNYTADWDPSLAVAPNGTIGIAWRRYVYNYNNDTESYNIYFATLNSAGNLLTGPTAITGYGLSSSAPWLYLPSITATDDNRFLLSWEYDSYSGSNNNVYIAGRNTAGANVFSPKAFTSNNQSYGSVLSSLTGGKAILTWKQDVGGPYYAVLNSSGTTYKAATDLGSSSWYYSPDAVLLPNGKTAVAWATLTGVNYSILNSAYNIESGLHVGSYGTYGDDLSVTTDASSHVIMSWTDASTYSTLVYALGDSAGNYLTPPMPYKSSSTFFNASWNGQGIAPFGNKVDINIGNSLMGRYEIPPRYSLVQSYASVQNGPVKVKSPEGKTFVPSERVIAGTSFNEVMGFPNNQLTTEYWFPWYDNTSMATWILVGNPTTTTAKVDIYVGGVKRTSAATIPAGGRLTPRYTGVQGGPVRVVSTNGVKIFTSERTMYGPNGAFNEVMGYPANQLTTEYWFPWYDNVTMATWILVGNPSTTSAAAVDLYIGGVKRSSYVIPKGGNVTPRFALQTGPVRVVSTNGVPIFTSERTIVGDSFNEVMGYPNNQLTTDYWYPWYDNVTMATWVLVGNPTGSTAAVDIYIGGVKRGSFSIPAGGRITPRFTLNSGPVRVVSTNGVKIFTSERVVYGPSFNEMMGYPGNKLTTEYWFPWYDSISMSTDILVGIP